jgi:hypothetical protein
LRWRRRNLPISYIRSGTDYIVGNPFYPCTTCINSNGTYAKTQNPNKARRKSIKNYALEKILDEKKKCGFAGALGVITKGD